MYTQNHTLNYKTIYICSLTRMLIKFNCYLFAMARFYNKYNEQSSCSAHEYWQELLKSVRLQLNIIFYYLFTSWMLLPSGKGDWGRTYGKLTLEKISILMPQNNSF